MEIGIDSFASANSIDGINDNITNMDSIEELLERIEYADKFGLNVFGIGEHYRKEFLDSASVLILSAAATRTKTIRLTSAVTVLSTADPVRVFQNFATLDLISKGRAEMVVGRGSFREAFPLFGYSFNDYDSLFAEKLDLLLTIRDNETINWSGKFRPPLINQSVYPRPIQNPIPIWLGVGGTPGSFARAGFLGLPLMVAIIGGETHRFRPLVDLYKEAWYKAGHSPEKMKIGVHSPGYVADTHEEAIEDYYPGFARIMTKIGGERGWPPVTKERFNVQNGPSGAFLVGDPEEIADKIQRHSKALGGISRFSLMMDNAGLLPDKFIQSIKLLGTKVAPLVQQGLQRE